MDDKGGKVQDCQDNYGSNDAISSSSRDNRAVCSEVESCSSNNSNKGKSKIKLGRLNSKKRADEVRDLIQDQWNITNYADSILAERMAKTVLLIEYVEKELANTGVVNNNRINPLCDYLSKLNNDLMRFYRMFRSKNSIRETSTKTPDFIEWMEQDD